MELYSGRIGVGGTATLTNSWTSFDYLCVCSDELDEYSVDWISSFCITPLEIYLLNKSGYNILYQYHNNSRYSGVGLRSTLNAYECPFTFYHYSGSINLKGARHK